MYLFIICIFLGLTDVSYASYKYDIAITSIFQNEGPNLEEWIEYHRMIGVDHFWLYNDASTDNWEQVLAPYISEGVVEVISWPSLSYKHHIGNQVNSMKDALKRAAGVAKWLALIDLDEFILPMEDDTLYECLENHFSMADGVYINWYHFGTGGIYLREGESRLFGLSACAHPSHPCNVVGKSIVRPEKVVVEHVWSGHHYYMNSDSQYYDGDANPLYFRDIDLVTYGKIHNKYIRLNHYMMGDEYYFHHIKYPRKAGIGVDDTLMWEHYHAFNLYQDDAIQSFIMDKHPTEYESFWKKHIN